MTRIKQLDERRGLFPSETRSDCTFPVGINPTARQRNSVLVVLLLAFVPAAVRADVMPAKIFGDHMVLQREMPVPIWGKAAPREKVTVHLLNQEKSAVTDAKGNWTVTLDPLEAGGPHKLTITGRNTVVFEDVLVGEVWICGGQSNMQWTMKGLDKTGKNVADANHPTIRLNQGSWRVCEPESAETFSATAFYFGVNLQKAIKVPIGLVHRSLGGTSARPWTPAAAIDADPALEPYLTDIKKAVPRPGSLYEGQIRPLQPYAMRGVIWYQGEADVKRPEEYANLIKTLIRSWRADWNEGDFPFLFVHLGAYGAAPKTPADVGWGPIRDAQLAALSLPNVEVASFHDSDSDLHPTKKALIGERLALVARAKVYEEKVVYSGPRFASLKIDGDKAVVKFNHLGGGLVVKGSDLRGFAIAGADGTFEWADAKIVGDKVVLTSPKVPRPAAVRYAYSSNPEATLYNRDGLPAIPFRTDGKK
jgi:sialate O-acetylesterase